MLNRDKYINHVIESRRNIRIIEFECKVYMTQDDQIMAEVISYFEFKEQKVFKIHGQVHLL